MFTIFALVFTLLGGLFFCRKDRHLEEFKWENHLGGYMLVIAAILWVVVILSILAHVVEWIWENAP